MDLFHIRKFNDDMLGYFIGEGPSLNTVLNLINVKKYEDARMQRISDLIAMPSMAKVVIIQESTTNGNLLKKKTLHAVMFAIDTTTTVREQSQASATIRMTRIMETKSYI
jgi:hypothetical protein